MRSAIKLSLAFLVLLAVLISNEKFISSITEKDFYIATADLNVRSGARTESDVLFTLKAGDEVELLSKKGNWYKIRYSGKQGYAFSKYLEYNRSLPDARVQAIQQIIPFIVAGIFAIIFLVIGAVVFRKVRDRKLLNGVTKPNRGTKSERDLALTLLKYGIPASNIFHDLYLRKTDGSFSQIDLVAIMETGIIVFEVKDYSGWIYGSGNQAQWTQVLAYGKEKYRFYNPIMQNNRHISELRKIIKHPDSVPVYSVVAFYGDCVLKNINFVPKGTFLVKSNRVTQVLRIIEKENQPIQYPDMNEIVGILRDAVREGDLTNTQVQHIENVKDMLGTERIFD